MELGSRGTNLVNYNRKGGPGTLCWPPIISPPLFCSTLPQRALPMTVPLPRHHQQLQWQLHRFNVSRSDHCLLSLQLSFSTLPAPTILGPSQDLQTIVLGTFLLSLTLALPPTLLTQLRLVGHHCITPSVCLQLTQPTLLSLY